MPDDRRPPPGPGQHAAADPDHPAVARRGLPARRRAPSRRARRHAADRGGRPHRAAARRRRGVRPAGHGRRRPDLRARGRRRRQPRLADRPDRASAATTSPTSSARSSGCASTTWPAGRSSTRLTDRAAAATAPRRDRLGPRPGFGRRARAGGPRHRRRRARTARLVRDEDLRAAGQRALGGRRRGDRDQRAAAHRALGDPQLRCRDPGQRPAAVAAVRRARRSATRDPPGRPARDHERTARSRDVADALGFPWTMDNVDDLSLPAAPAAAAPAAPRRQAARPSDEPRADAKETPQ